MYTPPLFAMSDLDEIHAALEAVGLAHLVTADEGGMVATPLPLLLDRTEGEFGTLYGHFARANPHWTTADGKEALVIFPGPDAYVSPSWYPSKAETGRVVPTWNYVAVHAYGPVEIIEDEAGLLDIVTRLTNRHETGRAEPWQLSDAPADFIASQLRAIVGLRIRITRLEGKRKMSQNRSAVDRAGVARGLGESHDERGRAVGALIPE